MGCPVVSVIMNCLNGARYLRDAIDSVFSQTYPNWEIVFWDNGSSDDSGVIARSYGEKVRYFRSASTTGLGLARNKALDQCRGEYIAFLDVDDKWLPEKLEQQVALFETNQNLGLVYSDSMFFDENGDRYKLFEVVAPKRGKVFGDLLERNFIHTVTMMYRKKALDALPYVFDNEITLAMDYDLSLRVAYFFELDYVENVLSKWRIHSGNESTKRRFLMPRENQIVIEKLCRELPDINVKYRKQINNFIKSFVHRQLAFEQWSEENRSRAREYLLPYLKDPTILITYLCTWILPFAVFDKIKSKALKTMSWYVRGC